MTLDDNVNSYSLLYASMFMLKVGAIAMNLLKCDTETLCHEIQYHDDGSPSSLFLNALERQVGLFLRSCCPSCCTDVMHFIDASLSMHNFEILNVLMQVWHVPVSAMIEIA